MVLKVENIFIFINIGQGVFVCLTLAHRSEEHISIYIKESGVSLPHLKII